MIKKRYTVHRDEFPKPTPNLAPPCPDEVHVLDTDEAVLHYIDGRHRDERYGTLPAALETAKLSMKNLSPA